MSNPVPKTWMPECEMKRIHVHWTAGAYDAGAKDKASYHILVEGDGKLVRGDTPISANADGQPKSGYASHTLNANTAAIGISICSMRGAKESPFDAGPSPLKIEQWEAMIAAVAQLSLRYNILVTPFTILTHAEVEPNLNIKQKGKWDITKLLFEPKLVGHKAIGDKLRLEVAIARDGVAPSKNKDIPEDLKLTRFRVAGVAPSTLNFRRSPGGEKVGELPEGAVVELLARFGDWSQVRTPAGYAGWVATAYLVAIN